MDAQITPAAALPRLPCQFQLLNCAGVLIASVRGDWTLDDDAVRERAISAAGQPSPQHLRALRTARVRVALLRGKA